MRKLAWLLPLSLGLVASSVSAQETQQLVIDLKDNLTKEEIKEFSEQYHLNLTPTALFNQTKMEIASFSEEEEGFNAEGMMAELKRDARVEIVEPLTWFYTSMTPNDPRFKEQWHMDRVDAPTAWDFATGRGVVVAVIDTGVGCYNRDGFHVLTDLEKTECVPGWNFVSNNDLAADDQSHGSHVAGTIAQSTNNGVGVAGLAFNSKLMPVKVLSATGSGSNTDVADGIRWSADHGAQVINMSLGGPSNSAVIQKACTYARSKGTTIIAAAGNSGGSVGYPGANEGVVAVSATDDADKLATFSSRGKEVDIAAPGVGVLQQTICKGGKNKCEEYSAFNGTSMASPHVAAAAALVVSLGVSNPDAVEKVLTSSARQIDTTEGGKLKFGAGILDAAAAVRQVSLSQAFWRTLMLLGLMMGVGTWAKRTKSYAASVWNPSFFLGAFLAAPGLFFLPFLLSRSDLIVDVLARPLADMDMFLGQSYHYWLPLASVVVPFALTACCYGVKLLRPVVAGVSTGLAAYLAAAVYQNQIFAPWGRSVQVLWFVANAVGCLWLARENLVGPDQKSDVKA